MKVAVFTSNQSRHAHLVKSIARIASEVFVVSEVTTVFPGQTDDFYAKSEVMKSYFSMMQESERRVFGEPTFFPSNVNVLPIKMGDLNSIPFAWISALENVDYAVVFGASWIKGALCDFLISKKAINIHMGVSPYYRGATCNFWALYENRPEFVGATIHYLSKGLDSGAMIMHALPSARSVSGFDLGMLAVKAAHEALCEGLKNHSLLNLPPQIQDKSKQIRYSKRAEFNDEVAANYLKAQPDEKFIYERCRDRELELFLRPFLF